MDSKHFGTTICHIHCVLKLSNISTVSISQGSIGLKEAY